MKAALIRLFRKLSLAVSFGILVAAFLLVILWNSIVHTVPVGHTAVLWHRLPIFGIAASRGPLSEGVHLILPWDKLYIYDLRLQTHDQSYQVLSKDGLEIDIQLTYRWKVVPQNVVALNQTIGPDYVERLMVPEIGSVAREAMALYSAEALFAEARSEVQAVIYGRFTENSHHNGVTNRDAPDDTSDVIRLSDVLITHVQLPEQINQAIRNKLEQAQIIEEYRYRVQREQLESERKRIEAEGIRSFQEIVTPAISESYLRWRGIEATLRLAESPNSKVVVIGNSATGLPLILDTTTNDRPIAGDLPLEDASGAAETLSLDSPGPTDQSSVEEIEHGIDGSEPRPLALVPELGLPVVDGKAPQVDAARADGN